MQEDKRWRKDPFQTPRVTTPPARYSPGEHLYLARAIPGWRSSKEVTTGTPLEQVAPVDTSPKLESRRGGAGRGITWYLYRAESAFNLLKARPP